ncbi:LacI family transcriptional regulator [Zhouia spongiae]|uniref:LacI family transcriptional regulator n=1 Tax=Zhouia spongiae TaxID=2202721 RepID=A0ABY3YJX3_9FLAO|nr:LacI family DNA-binding transcriptional regulator [Zhouia spongiae]UNY97473.1 LacI family transcriptional regulator [Zhouia spongiae]
MKKGNATIHEIAKALGIDSSTVSRALNNSDRVTQKTKEKVLAKAKELGYRRNLIASNLRRNKSNTIGVIVPRISRHFFSSTIAGIEEAAFVAGYNVIICQSMEKLDREKSILNNLWSNRVDGVLISVSMETVACDHLKFLKDNNVPLVFFDRHCSAMEQSSKVLIDDTRASYEAVSHLIEKGCRKIVHFSGPQSLEIYKNRLRGYKEALEDHGIGFNDDLVVSSTLMEVDGKEMIQDLLHKHSDIDGVFSANDVAAIGAMKYLKKKGKRIPDDIAIVGFSNEPISEAIEPSLTTIDQSGFEIGRTACNLLIENINSKEKVLDRTLILNPTLIKRDSTNR